MLRVLLVLLAVAFLVLTAAAMTAALRALSPDAAPPRRVATVATVPERSSEFQERADRGRRRPLQPPAAPDTRGPVPARPAPQRTVRPPARAVQPRPATSGTAVSSTAYCLTGGMADGKPTHAGAVAGNRWPLGTRLRVSDSPYGPGVFIVEDRIGSGSQLDFALPGDCAGARRWGRRTVTVEVVG